MDLSVIMPAYLEEENLRILLPRVKTVLNNLTPHSEIIVVDTEKPLDGTSYACEESGAIYVNRTGSNSYGSAIRTGLEKAKGKSIIFMDADGSHHPEFIKKLYAEREQNDIVIASRYIDGGHTENSAILVLMSKIVNLGYAIVLGLRVKDVSNSFKLYRADFLKELNLTCDNFDVVEEILFKILRKHKDCKIKELPFSFKQRMFGETKRNLPLFVMTYIATLIKLRFFS
ncbi:MAG: glycosyltransferase [Halobacteriovoraceae bacterium]|nr:glycosyltransferase [Halobacteriovoraceae bacterium]